MPACWWRRRSWPKRWASNVGRGYAPDPHSSANPTGYDKEKPRDAGLFCVTARSAPRWEMSGIEFLPSGYRTLLGAPAQIHGHRQTEQHTRRQCCGRTDPDRYALPAPQQQPHEQTPEQPEETAHHQRVETETRHVRRRDLDAQLPEQPEQRSGIGTLADILSALSVFFRLVTHEHHCT